MVGDVDNAVVLEAGQVIPCQVGNVSWRSPEAQLGVSVKASTDVFSFGLVVHYIIRLRSALARIL
jgi:hypothetical protein